MVKRGSVYGYVSESGLETISPKYLYATNFSEGLAAVMMDDGKFKFIDKYENTIIKPKKYDSVGIFRNGLCKVTKKGMTWEIDKKGDRVGEKIETGNTDVKKPKINIRNILKKL